MYPLRCSPRYCFHVCCHCYPDTFTKRLIFTPRTSRVINLLRYVKEKLHVWFLRPPTRPKGVQRQSALETVIYIFIWQPNRQISPSENHPIVSHANAAELHLFSAEILFYIIWFSFYLFRTTWVAFFLSFLSGSNNAGPAYDGVWPTPFPGISWRQLAQTPRWEIDDP